MPESRPQSGGARAREPEVYRVISRIHVGAPDPVAVSVARGRLYRAWPFCIIAGLRQERQLRSFAVMKTFSAKQADIKRDWYVVDATGKTLGRLASEIARRLRGKHKPEYTPHVDTGDYIIVVNAEKVKVTGRKATDKVYYSHSGWIGGLKSITFEKLIDKAPERVVEYAVKGMLPKNRLGRAMFKKLKVYAGPDHRHEAQQPKPLEI